jgi:metallo-beta-lactamase family protein
VRLTSAGAAGTVTGSCHLIETGGRRLLVDCGMFQGFGLTALNREPFPFDVAGIDGVLVTHGHLDHVGRLPLLVRRGYRGPIYATRATREIAQIILLDAAKLQMEDHERRLRRAREGREGREGENEVTEPLYLPGDVSNTMPLFRDVDFERPLELGGVTVTWRPAGHILGSAFLELASADGRLVASGDLGNREGDVHRDPVLPSPCDAVLVETTYGDRSHRSLAATLEEFEAVVKRAAAECGAVLIPTFALERAQNVLYHLKLAMEAGRIPRLPVIVDSPMAAQMTRLYEECANDFTPEIQALLARGEDPFEPPGLSYSVTAEDSRRINAMEECAIVLAGSGMMTGGRILHHLKHRLSNEATSVIVVGYQATGTLGRRLVDGAKRVKIHGREIEVLARIHTINGFSAHADQDDLLAWLEPTGGARIYMVHGEPPVMGVFARVLAAHGREAVAVERGRAYELG